MKLHAVFGSIGAIVLLASFLVPPRVAAVTYILGVVLMVIACVLVTIDRYEGRFSQDIDDRVNRRRF